MPQKKKTLLTCLVVFSLLMVTSFAPVKSIQFYTPVLASITERVTVSSSGEQGNGYSYGESISADGRYVAFVSDSTNLVNGDTNGAADVFVHDRQTSITERVSVSTSGEQGNSYSRDPKISADGRYIAFLSDASNLVSGDTNEGLDGFFYVGLDIFVHDRQTGITERVSVSSGGEQGNKNSIEPFISADGRYVSFSSNSTNLVTGDTNEHKDVLVHDRQTGITERVSISSSGEQASGWDSGGGWLSADGRFVSFYSRAPNLVSGDTNMNVDGFVRDRQTGITELVTVSSSGEQGSDLNSSGPISADGRYVALLSFSTNLVSGDTNGKGDGFVRDRLTGITELVTVSSSGEQGNDFSWPVSISDDGRFVAFYSYATNLVSGDTNGEGDGFVHDRQNGTTERISLSSSGEQGNKGGGNSSSIASDGNVVAFNSDSSNLVSGDTNGVGDIFVRNSCMVGTCGTSDMTAHIYLPIVRLP